MRRRELSWTSTTRSSSRSFFLCAPPSLFSLRRLTSSFYHHSLLVSPISYRTSILSLQSAVQSLPLAAPPPPPPPSRKNTSNSSSNTYTHALPPSRSRSHHSIKNPYDDSDYDDRLSFEDEYEEKKFGYGRDELEGFYGGLPPSVAAAYEHEPQPLPYGYSASERRGSGGRRGGTYEDWDEVNLKERSTTR